MVKPVAWLGLTHTTATDNLLTYFRTSLRRAPPRLKLLRELFYFAERCSTSSSGGSGRPLRAFRDGHGRMAGTARRQVLARELSICCVVEIHFNRIKLV